MTPQILRSAILTVFLGLAATLGIAAPSVSSISPSSGATQGGTAITINGSGFLTNPPSAFVTLSGASMAITSITDTRITATTPAGQGTAKQLTVTVSGVISNAATFSYLPPAINSVAPATFSTSGGTLLTITGSNFGLTPTVTAGSNNLSMISSNHSSITCIVPAGQGSSIPVRVTTAGQASNLVFISYSPPSITGITPATAGTSGGNTITLTGSNFGLSPEIVFNGQTVSPTSFSHTEAAFLLPAGQGTGIPVSLNVAGQASNTVTFNYDAPVITSISPAGASTSGGTTITITGHNFGLSGSVSIGGLSAPVTQGGYSHTAITCTLPAGQGSNLPVVVTSAGRSSNSGLFSYNPPAITGISPATGPTAGGSLITITGSSFGTSPSVLFGSTSVSPSSASHGEVVFALPAGEGRNLPVSVSVAGQVSTSTSFSYNDPVLTSITAAAYPTAGAVPITVIGSNFGINPTVRVGSSIAPVVSAASTHNQLVCTLPPGQGLGESVTVTVAGTVSNALSLDYDAPVITSISPAGASTSGGTTITITGHNFGLSGSVSIGGLNAPVTQGGYSHTAITCTLPAGQGTNLPVVVTSAGRSSNSGLFSYNPPAITGISAASYPTSGGTLITITGSNFGLNHSVTVGGQAAALQAGSSHTQVICTLPEGQGTNVAVVLTAGGQASPAAFINYNAPAITSISPGNGPTSGSIPITINGSNFGITPQVSIGGKPASTVFIAHNRIVFTLPAGGGADRQLIVTTEGQVSNAVLFDYDGDTFSSWSESIAWNGLDSSPGADPRNTGWENVLAYALGVNPTTTTGGETASRTPRVHGMPTFSRDSSGRLRISFWRRRGSSSPDLIYQVRFSNHPGGTEWDPPAPDPQIEVVDDIWEFCTFSDVETTSQTRFGRVKVELVTPP